MEAATSFAFITTLKIYGILTGECGAGGDTDSGVAKVRGIQVEKHCKVTILLIPHHFWPLNAVRRGVRHACYVASIKDDAMISPGHEVWAAVERDAAADPPGLVLDGGSIPPVGIVDDQNATAVGVNSLVRRVERTDATGQHRIQRGLCRRMHVLCSEWA